MTSIVWLRNALKNIESIHAYYKHEGFEEEARKIILLIQKTVNQLKEFPDLGRPGRVPGTRELVVTRTPYLVIYQQKKQQVQILRVLHSAQKWPTTD